MSFKCPLFNSSLRANSEYYTGTGEEDQLQLWKDTHKGNNYISKNPDGHNEESKTTTKTIGPFGPPVLMDSNFVRSMQIFNRRIIPLRVVYGKGIGIHGYFKVTHDISKLCRAKVFQFGKITELFARFSSNDSPGQPDTINTQTRSFSTKLYTEDGNLDILAVSLPVTIIRDPSSFSSININTIMNNPQTGRKSDYNSEFDTMTLLPEIWNFQIRKYSQQGYPSSFRHMNTFPISIYQLENSKGDLIYARFKYKPNGGVKYLTQKQADDYAQTKPNIMIDDLYDAIINGETPSYTLCMQTMTEEKRLQYENETPFNIFDNTKIWPENIFPFQNIGIVVLNRMTSNHFNETEQVTFDPTNLVPGLQIPMQESLFQARLIAYQNAHRHRLGSNSSLLPINEPKGVPKPLVTYYRNGAMNSYNSIERPSYYPNTFNGPRIIPDEIKSSSSRVVTNGKVDRFSKDNSDIHYIQVKEFLKNELTHKEWKRTGYNIASKLLLVEPFIKDGILDIFRTKIDAEFTKIIENYISGHREDYENEID